MDYSKLKYYEILCEKCVIESEPDNLDGIINTLEEKQFEYFKRLETTKDEHRKDEINELLNIIDLQLKELAAIKTAINTGILVEEKSIHAQPKINEITENHNKVQHDEELIYSIEGNKKSSKGLVLAIVVLTVVVAVVAIFILNGNRTNQNTAINDEVADARQDDDEDSTTRLNVYPGDSSFIEQMSIGSIDITDGVYVLGVGNKSLIDAGLQPGDRFVSINGKDIQSTDDVYNASQGKKPGDELTVVVQRGDKEITVVGNYERASDDNASGTIEYEIDGYKCKFNYDTGDFSLAW